MQPREMAAELAETATPTVVSVHLRLFVPKPKMFRGRVVIKMKRESLDLA